jgi:glycosyltransferase involved in cell wall biosynthesis
VTEPAISVGIPFRDPGPFLERAVRSVFAQTLADWELILLDDGSSDGALDFVRGIRDRRVRVSSDGEHRGLAKRLNQIASMALAPCLARMDADDLMHPERLAAQLAMLRTCAEPTVIGTDAYAIDAQDRPTGFKHTIPRRGYQAKRSFIHPSVMAPTRWFRDHPYSEDPAFHRCEDAELWTRCAATTPFAILPRALLYYREVGVFSFANYRSTQQGVAELVRRRFTEPWLTAQARMLVLQAKTWCVGGLAAVGAADLWTRSRSHILSAEQRSAAEEGLSRIAATAVPLAADAPPSATGPA